MDILWFFVKVFFCAVPVYLFVIPTVVNLLAVIGSPLSYPSRIIPNVYLTFSRVVYAYCFAFVGALYHSIIDIYQDWRLPVWVVWTLCIISVWIWYRFTNAQGNKAAASIRSDIMSSLSKRNALLRIGIDIHTATALKSCWVMLVAFVVFIFFKDLHNTMFFGLPDYLIGLF
jgi:hypothetical protein